MGGTYGGIFGVLAFTITVAHSLIRGGGTESTIKLAVICLFVFGGIGLLLGRVAQWTIEDSIRSRLHEATVGDGTLEPVADVSH